MDCSQILSILHPQWIATIEDMSPEENLSNSLLFDTSSHVQLLLKSFKPETKAKLANDVWTWFHSLTKEDQSNAIAISSPEVLGLVVQVLIKSKTRPGLFLAVRALNPHKLDAFGKGDNGGGKGGNSNKGFAFGKTGSRGETLRKQCLHFSYVGRAPTF